MKYTVAFVCVCMLGVLCSTAFFRTAIERQYLRYTLADFIFPPGEADISLMRTERFALLTRLDPLFAFEGSDPQALAESVAYLAASQKAYSALYREKGTETEAAEVAALLYPQAFLESIPALESARQKVLAAPTPAHIGAYADAFRTTLIHYRAYIEALRSAYASFTESESRTLGFWGGTLTVDSAMQALTQLEADAVRAEKIQANRIACAEGTRIFGCENPTRALAALIPAHPTDTPAAIPKQVQKNAEIIEQTITHTATPLVALLESACMAPGTSPAYFTYESIQTPGFATKAHRNIFLNELWFYDLRAMPEALRAERPFLGAAYTAGLGFLYHNPARMYKCPDAGKDDAKVRTIRAVYEALRTGPLFGPPFIEHANPLIRDAAVKEKAFLASPVLEESALIAYAEAVGTALYTVGERDMAHLVGTEAVLRAESLLVSVKNQSAQTETLVMNAARGNLNNVAVERAFGPSEPESLLRIRGYPYFFLFAYNPSIAPSAPSFFAERKTFDPAYFHSATYPGDLSDMQPFEVSALIEKSRADFREEVWAGHI